MINNHKAHEEWKIQLIMQINFISLEIGEIRKFTQKVTM